MRQVFSQRICKSLLLGLAAANTLAAQGDASRPKLVVGIVIDQLRTDYIDSLEPIFTDKGFRRLASQGLYLKDVDFKAPMADAAAGTTLLYTGAYPAVNGIASARVFDPTQGKEVSSMEDGAVMGNFTSDAFSPSAIRVSTLADELAVDGAGLAQVFSIAPDAETALAMAGHAATSAFWLDDNSGKWSSTTYFRETPKAISQRNHRDPISARLDTLKWTPLLDLSRYPSLPAQKKFYPFRYSFPKADRNVYRRFKASPLVNAEVTDVALDYLSQLRLGQRGDVVDMLNIGYTAAPWEYVSDGDPRLELEDTYVRLDRQLGRLLDAIDAGVGLENALVFVSSTGRYEDLSQYDSKYRVPTGDFSIKRAQSLLNAFLSAKFGNGQYVSRFSGNSVSFDPKTLEQHGVEPVEAARAARDFLSRMAGIAEVRTYREILASASPETEALRLSIDPRNAADIYMEFTPGWNVVHDHVYPAHSTSVRTLGVNTPAFILSPQVERKQVSTPVEAVSLAPTLAGIIRIRAPNGAKEKPIIL